MYGCMVNPLGLPNIQKNAHFAQTGIFFTANFDIEDPSLLSQTWWLGYNPFLSSVSVMLVKYGIQFLLFYSAQLPPRSA